MKRIYILLVVLVIIAIGIVVFILSQKSTPISGSPYTTSTNPFGLPVGSVPVSTTTANGLLNLKLQDGTIASVPDFTKVNQPTTANAENGYQIVGSNTGDFHITYYPQNWGILVSLYAEPLGSVRIAAENALRTSLGLSDSQLCKLTIDVRTSADVSDTYSGRNLGLSFCPGATTLPQ